MTTMSTKLKLMLAGASCAVIAACSADTSISSPGEGQLPSPPDNGGGGGGGGATTSIDRTPAGGCPAAFGEVTTTIGSFEVTACQTAGTITGDTTLPGVAANGDPAIYFLNGAVFVGNDAGADASSSSSGGASPAATTAGVDLTIEAGAYVVGASPADYLVVTRGNTLDVQGEQFSPVIMTSANDLEATLSGNPRSFNSGINAEWGGLIINGRAPINACNNPADRSTSQLPDGAECEKSGEGDSGLFGGNDPADSSGALRYMQLRYAGFEVTDGDELNGIAFQGTGSDTLVEFVQVHNNFDDGIEFFGGTTDAKYLVLTGIGDDSLDATDGWTGNVQYALVIQSEFTGDNGFEMDNFEEDDDILPRTNPTIANFTLIGQQNDGMRLREGFAGDLMNGVVVGFGGACADVDDSSSHTQAENGDLTLRSTLFDCPTPFEQDDTPDFSEEDWFNGTAPFTDNVNNVVTTSTLGGVFPGSAEEDVTAIDPSTDALVDADRRAFFDSVDYIGAFGPEETASNSWATGWTFGLFDAPEECPDGTSESGEVIDGQIVCQLSGVVDQDTTLVPGLLYELVGAVFVGQDRGGDAGNPLNVSSATLEVLPGVTIFGSSAADYLVVSRGSQLFSTGTQGAPVVWTSRNDVEAAAAGNPRPFDSGINAEWGGLIINGRAPINACNNPADRSTSQLPDGAECEKSGEGDSGLFGGNDPADSSGALRYMQLRYAGFEVTDGDELNGIAFQGTGSDTLVEFVQVHNNFDDGIEFFGGTTDAKYLVLTGIGDDSLDATDGWTGNVQYALVIQSEFTGDNGFEMDNFEEDDDILPRTNPTIANFTLIGQQNDGMRLREGFAGDLMNGVVVGFGGACADVDDSSSHTQAENGDLTLRSTLFDCPTPFEQDDTPDFSEEDWFNGTAPFTDNVNNVVTTNTLANVLEPGSAELGVAAIDPSTDTLVDADRRDFFDSVDYIGAVRDEDDNWYLGWSLLPANAQ